MRYLKNRWRKTLFIALPLLLTAVFVSSSVILTKNSKSSNLKPQIGTRYYDNFAADKIHIVKRGEDNRLLFSISADKVVHRKRISRLFVYQNLKEIYMKVVKIDFYPHDNVSINKNENIAIPVNDIGGSFISLGKPPTPIEDYLAGRVDVKLDLLTRLLFEDLSINIHLPNSKKISLAARSAHINTDFKNIIMEGAVRIIASDGKELIAPEAVWSKKFNGVYLPDGYILPDGFHQRKAFFVINQNGKFLRMSGTPDITYTDFIDEKENVLYAYLYQKMPAYARPMSGMFQK